MTTSLRSCIPCEKIENDSYDWYVRHNAKLEETARKKSDIIFIGDSITHFWNCEEGITHGVEVWEEFYSKRAVMNLGFGFDRTQNMLWRIEHGEMAGQNPKVVVINAGTNHFSITKNYSGDTPEEAFEGVKLLYHRLKALASDALFIVMGVFPRQPEELQEKIDRLNVLLEKYISSLPASEKTVFLNLKEKFLYPDGSFNTELYKDRRCHPNQAGYRIWANALEPLIAAALKD